jgi:NAD+ dependent glucose-6-phosphate dehydrogenase
MHVVVTGAAGGVGREVMEALGAVHDLRPVDCQPVPERQALLADISKLPAAGDPHAWTDAFTGADVVVHLAEDPRPQADWQRVLHNNIVGTWNVLWTAAEHGVRRVVYASSHWAVRLLQPESGSAFVCERRIGSGVIPRPDTPYGAAKVAGETLGRMLVDIRKLQTFVAVRIGYYHPAPPDDAHYRQYGISGTDIRELFRRCVEGEFAGFHVVYGASDVAAAPFDLSDTCRLLDWEPAGLEIR